MTSKEALNELKNEVDTSYDEDYEKWINTRYNAILKDLERLEQVEQENVKLKNQILSLELDTCIPELRKENKKLKQALDILKDKYYIELFDDRLFILIDNLEDLTEEEYDILKEALKTSKTSENT